MCIVYVSIMRRPDILFSVCLCGYYVVPLATGELSIFRELRMPRILYYDLNPRFFCNMGSRRCSELSSNLPAIAFTRYNLKLSPS
jgi:hypothetical protein